MSQGKLRLARMLVRDHFGPVTEAVAWALLTKGRLSLNNLTAMLTVAQTGFVARKRKLELTGTSIHNRFIREALFVLIQHNIATYAENVEAPTRPPVVYYSISVDAILARLRIPHIIAGVTRNYGAEAGVVMQAVFADGRLSLSQLQGNIASNPKTAGLKAHDIHKAFSLLAKKGFLSWVDELDSMTSADLRITSENAELEHIGPAPTAKMITEAKRKAEDKTRARYETKTSLGTKRQLEDASGPSSSKKRKVEFEDSGDVVSDAVYWRVDLDRCFVISRNEKIVHLVRRHVNDMAGAIVKEILGIVTENMRNVSESGDLKLVTAHQLAKILTKTKDHHVDYPSGEGRDFETVLGDYLSILSTDFPRILTRAADRGVGGTQYMVDFQEADHLLKLGEILRLIDQKLGAPSATIWKIVLQKGKLDDKQVSKLSMIAPKEARERMYNLFRGKFLHLQAVPKGTDRSAQRTFFLYYTDLRKTSELILSALYETTAKLRVRLTHENALKANLIQKLEKAGDDEAQLEQRDKEGRDQLESIRNRLEVAEARLGEQLLTLRDN